MEDLAVVPETPDDADRDLAGALHEVSNALTVVLGWLDTVADELPEGTTAKAVGVARAHALRGHAIARRAIGAESFPDNQHSAARRVAEDALLAVEPNAARRSLGLELLGDAGADLEHPGAALQVLINLLLNAVAFTPGGARVQLELTESEDGVRFAVQDEGPGVPDERADSLLDAPDSTRRGGAGIGLPHSRALAEQYGGSLQLAQCERGARFELLWPTSHLRSQPRGKPVTARPLDGASVLVVDDDAAVRSLVELALTSRGVTVHQAGDMNDVEQLTAGGARFDAVLLDLSPLEDVDRTVEVLRAEDPGLPLIVISGSALGVPGQLAASAHAWVRKPFEMGEVVEVLSGALRR